MRPVPTERVTSLAGATAPAGWATAGPVSDAARPAASAAAIAVPSAARFSFLLLIILPGSHRNERDVVAARDAHDRTHGPIDARSGTGYARSIVAVVAVPRGHRGALEAGNVRTHRVGRIGIVGLAGDGEQHLALGAR